jgi:hypothetical protein
MGIHLSSSPLSSSESLFIETIELGKLKAGGYIPVKDLEMWWNGLKRTTILEAVSATPWDEEAISTIDVINSVKT